MREPAVRSATDVAQAVIHEMIESGYCRPGEQLNVDRLAAQLGVSRTPVRDALHRLRTEGMVEIRPRRGVFVREITAREVEEVYALKTAIEPLAAQWAASHGTERQKRRLAELAEYLEVAGSSENLSRAADAVGQIHDLLVAMSASAVLLDVYRVFQGRVRMLRHLNMAQPGRLASSVAQHQDLVTHVIAGDGAAAYQAMLDHMRDASRSVRGTFDAGQGTDGDRP